MKTGGFITLHRQILDWEWYQNINTFRVFLHCLLMANYSDGRFEGKEIKRGQFVTSLDHLSKQTKLTVKEVRTALDHLIWTGELASQTFNRFRIITVVKYDVFQTEGNQIGKQTASKGQAEGKQGASKGQQYNNNNNAKMEEWNNHLPGGLMDDDDAFQIQHDHDRVITAAEDAGFKMSNNVRASLIALFAEFGLDKVLEGIQSCSDHGAANLAYLRACMNGEDRKPSQKPKVAAQAYDQRDYSAVQEDILRAQNERIIARLKGVS